MFLSIWHLEYNKHYCQCMSFLRNQILSFTLVRFRLQNDLMALDHLLDDLIQFLSV